MKKLMVLALAALMLCGFAGTARAADIKPYNLSAEYRIIPASNRLEVTVYFENNQNEAVPFDYRVRFLANSYPYLIEAPRYELAGNSGRVVPGMSKTLILHLNIALGSLKGLNYAYDTIGEKSESFSIGMLYGKTYSISFDIVKDPSDDKGAVASLTQMVKMPVWMMAFQSQEQPLVWQDGAWVKSY